MNQRIQFRDNFSINLNKAALSFDAIVDGQIIGCYVPLTHVKADMSSIIDEHHFDWEEQATQLIENEKYNDAGEVWLNQI
ncbi:DUF1488 family protein [Flocculibacter collagenilyticus]|uniref:DUF1488 family protein n=1 Tax=Flocculibacter collagenilyticus TaxID=2744479 RepID=UPI0018F6A5FE|nr:DUF1488 family protein [Flocculibacter collagenilyticus]